MNKNQKSKLGVVSSLCLATLAVAACGAPPSDDEGRSESAQSAFVPYDGSPIVFDNPRLPLMNGRVVTQRLTGPWAATYFYFGTNGQREPFSMSRAIAALGLPLDEVPFEMVVDGAVDEVLTTERTALNRHGNGCYAVRGEGGNEHRGSCLMLLGVADAELFSGSGTKLRGGGGFENASCDSPDLWARDPETCLRRIDPMLYDVWRNTGGLERWGFPITDLRQCEWWDGDWRGQRACVWFERGKIGRFDETIDATGWWRWQGEALGAKMFTIRDNTRRMTVLDKLAILPFDKDHARVPDGGLDPAFRALLLLIPSDTDTTDAWGEHGRAFGQLWVDATCERGKVLPPVVSNAIVEGGEELPAVKAPAHFSFGPNVLDPKTGDQTIRFVISAEPATIAEPSFMAVKARAHNSVWNVTELTLHCNGDQLVPTVRIVDSTRFPTHLAWTRDVAIPGSPPPPFVSVDRRPQNEIRDLWSLPPVPSLR